MKSDDELDYGYLEDRDFIAEPEWEGKDLWRPRWKLEWLLDQRAEWLDRRAQEQLA